MTRSLTPLRNFFGYSKVTLVNRSFAVIDGLRCKWDQFEGMQHWHNVLKYLLKKYYSILELHEQFSKLQVVKVALWKKI